MAMTKRRGGVRPGAGRPPSHWRKEITAYLEAANASGEPPSVVAFLEWLWALPGLPHDERMRTIKLLLPHVAPRLSAVDVSTTRRISVDELDTEQLQAFAAKLMRSASDRALDVTPRIVEAAPLPVREKP